MTPDQQTSMLALLLAIAFDSEHDVARWQAVIKREVAKLPASDVALAAGQPIDFSQPPP